MPRFHLTSAIFAALGAAFLFGASTPFAKQLTSYFSPALLAGLLYFGSGIGLILARLIRDKGWHSTNLLSQDWAWLIGAISFGGVIGPILFIIGLSQTSATSASLLLNLEAVLTAVIAWTIFKENADRRIIIGMFLILAGGIVLSWPNRSIAEHNWIGPLFICAACLCWAFDNNLTRKVSASDPLFIAACKGLISGVVNVSLAFAVGGIVHPLGTKVILALSIGFIGYGVSLVLFIIGLRGLGAARTGAYFSIAPFIGAAIAILFFHEPTSALFWLAAALMGSGVWLHLTEQHAHEHTHEAQFHNHSHVHDAHHQHAHHFPWDGTEPHSHPHQHNAITHSHPHYPDIHHHHKHSKTKTK